MKLFTKAQYEQLIKNGSDPDPAKDHPPVVKLFMTGSACTWLISELDPENPDIAFGLCDLGMGSPELGSVSLSKIQEAADPRYLRFLERDKWFEGKYPLSVYARASSRAEQIVEDDSALKAAAPKLKL